LIVAAAVAAALPLAALLALQQTYSAYSPHVTTILASLPPEEREPPAALGRAVARVHPQGVAGLVAMRLLAELHLEPAGHLRHHYREFVWTALLPRTRTAEEILALYAHTMVSEAGQGLDLAARHHFNKPAGHLTDREALALVIIDINPAAYSPAEHPERLEAALDSYGE
jgi:membrane carboxypeptidase/penicillin-binding protein